LGKPALPRKHFMNDTFTVYVTKRALQDGIEECEVRRCSGHDAVQTVGLDYAEVYQGEGKDWHRTLDSAVKRAEQARQTYLVGYRLEIKRLEAMRWVCLVNHADMVKGHYCVGRPTEDSPRPSGLIFWEFWSEESKAWASAGTLYRSKAEAQAKLDQLRQEAALA